MLRGALRALRILWTLGRRNLFWGLYRDVYLAHGANPDCQCEANRRLERRAVHLREALEELGPTFVKLGQLLSRRPDLAPRAYLAELGKLQDRARPVPWAAIRAQLERRCICGEQIRHEQHDRHCLHCRHLDEVFEAFEKTPVAAASLAQVHRAVFDGQPVAVKVLRPGVLNRIVADLAIMKRLARPLMRGLGIAGTLDAKEFFDEFRTRLLAEVDLQREALNMERFRLNRDPDGDVTAPGVFWEFRRSDLLVMEFVDGRPIETVMRGPQPKRARLARLLVRDYLKQVFVDNFFHADPHPGNLFVGKRETLVYLDFGSMGELSEELRRAMHQLMRAVVEGDADRAVRAVLRLGQADARDVDVEGLRQDLARVIYLCRSRPGSRWTDEILETARRHAIRLPRISVALAQGLLLVESVALELDSEFTFFEELQAMAPKLFLAAVEEELTRTLPRAVEEVVESLRHLPRLIEALTETRVVLESGRPGRQPPTGRGRPA
jgi:ubiquinone biosynthesis protein